LDLAILMKLPHSAERSRRARAKEDGSEFEDGAATSVQRVTIACFESFAIAGGWRGHFASAVVAVKPADAGCTRENAKFVVQEGSHLILA
jgi:hypothetical protein